RRGARGLGRRRQGAAAGRHDADRPHAAIPHVALKPDQIRRNAGTEIRLDRRRACALELAKHRKHFVTRGDREVGERPPQGSCEPLLVLRMAEREQERSEEHTSELQSPDHLVCRLLLEKKKKRYYTHSRDNVSEIT